MTQDGVSERLRAPLGPARSRGVVRGVARPAQVAGVSCECIFQCLAITDPVARVEAFPIFPEVEDL